MLVRNDEYRGSCVVCRLKSGVGSREAYTGSSNIPERVRVARNVRTNRQKNGGVVGDKVGEEEECVKRRRYSMGGLAASTQV